MIRLIILSGLFIHGLIHLVGFGRQRIGAATLSESKKVSSSSMGVLWLAACVLFIITTRLYALQSEFFWISALLALALSQTLIFLHWKQAKYGTIANVLVAILVLSAAFSFRFDRRVAKEKDHIVQESANKEIAITETDINDLPDPVQRWLQHSNVISNVSPNIVHVIQSGTMRTSPDGSWMSFTADQVVTINPPAFVWSAKVKFASIFEIVARDKFSEGEGNMLIKPLAVFTAANSRGPEINQGTMIRFLAEMCWYPQAALSSYITWEPRDEKSAFATMTYRGLTVSGIFFFDENGNVTGFEADRFGEFNGELRKERWSVKTRKFQKYGNVQFPSETDVSWRLKDGDFNWLKLEVKSIQ